MKRFFVPRNEFNREHYPDMIGQIFDTPPSYVRVIEISSDCSRCSHPIEPQRIKALNGNVHTCVRCSKTGKVAGFMSWEHKTAPVLNLCSAEDADAVAFLGRRKGTGVINGIRMKGH
jgi:hypothetical protein